MRWILLIGLLLVGCNSSGNSTGPNDASATQPQGALVEPHLITGSGVIVFWESAEVRPEDLDVVPSREEIETWWIEIQQCTSLYSEIAPVAHVPTHIRDALPHVKRGTAGFFYDSEVYISVSMVNARWVWKHEFLHYLAHVNNKPEYQDHAPEWLWQCQWN